MKRLIALVLGLALAVAAHAHTPLDVVAAGGRCVGGRAQDASSSRSAATCA